MNHFKQIMLINVNNKELANDQKQIKINQIIENHSKDYRHMNLVVCGDFNTKNHAVSGLKNIQVVSDYTWRKSKDSE